MNNVQLIGRLARDVELRYTQGTEPMEELIRNDNCRKNKK